MKLYRGSRRKITVGQCVVVAPAADGGYEWNAVDGERRGEGAAKSIRSAKNAAAKFLNRSLR